MSTTVMWIVFAVSFLIFLGSVTLLILQRRAMKKQDTEQPEDESGAIADPVIDQSVFDEPDGDMKIAPAKMAAEPIAARRPESPQPPVVLQQPAMPRPAALTHEPDAVSEAPPAEDYRTVSPVVTQCRDVVILTQQDEGYIKNVFPGGTDITVGRAPGNSLVINDPSVSGRHCIFRTTPHGLALEDLNSSNGTLLGNVRVREPALVEAGDRIWVGMTGLFIQSV